MIEKRNKSRVAITVYFDEKNSEISSNSFEAASNSSRNDQTIFENEKDEDKMKKSVNNFNDLNEDFIFFIDEYFISNALIVENSSTQNHDQDEFNLFISVTEIIVKNFITDSEE
jgi:hypothetical protein